MGVQTLVVVGIAFAIPLGGSQSGVQEVRESFEGVPVGWDLGNSRIEAGGLRVLGQAQAPQLWQDFELRFEARDLGMLTVFYGSSGARLDIGHQTMTLSAREKILARGSVRNGVAAFFLRVEEGAFQCGESLDGMDRVILDGRGPNSMGPIVFRGESPTLDEVKIRPIPWLGWVRPRTLLAGAVGELLLIGSDLSQDAKVDFDPPGITAESQTLLAPGVLELVVRVPADHRPGVHAVHVTYPSGKRLMMADALTVIAPPTPPEPVLEARAEPAPDPATERGWIFALFGLLGSAASFGLGFWSGRLDLLRSLWKRAAENLWEAKAELKLPEIDRPCAWSCRPSATLRALDWGVKSVCITPEPSRDAQDGHELKGADLAPLNDFARLAALLDDEGEARKSFALLTDSFENYLRRQRELGRSPAALRITFALEKPLATTFDLVHREPGSDGKLAWVTKRSWSRRLRAGQLQELAVLRGPGPGPDEYARLRTDFQDALLALARRTRWRV